MEPFIYGGIGALVGVIATAIYCAGTRSQLVREHEVELSSVWEKANGIYHEALEKRAAAHTKRIDELSAEHAAELVAEFKRGKESDGIIKNPITGRIDSVNPNHVPRKKPAKKVCAVKPKAKAAKKATK